MEMLKAGDEQRSRELCICTYVGVFTFVHKFCQSIEDYKYKHMCVCVYVCRERRQIELTA